MERKPAQPGFAAAYPELDQLNKQIAELKQRTLPYEPHLLTVPTSTPYRETPIYEYRGTPFEDYEVRELQHMTMISSSRRGVARTEGDWQARIESQSPAALQALSNTATPSHTKDQKVYKKFSLRDYANAKKNGTKLPSPPTTAGDTKVGHATYVSASTSSTPMSRLPSFESGAPEVKLNGVAAPLVNSHNLEKPGPKGNANLAVPSSNRPDTKTNAPATNASERPPNHTLASQRSLSHLKPPVNHQLPPRPNSPLRKSYDVKPVSEQKKRPLESSGAGQSEKRAKIDHDKSSSTSQNHHPRKIDSSESKKLAPAKNIQSTSTPNRASPLPNKTAPDAKSSQAKEIRTDKPRPLPGRLGPLPEDLTELVNPKKPGSVNSTPSALAKYNGQDTMVGKDSRGKSPLRSSTPAQASHGSQASKKLPSPLKPLPKMLSPTLPDVVERELERIQAKKTAKEKEAAKETPPGASRDTVGARYEEVRRPNVPGVARKTVTPKVGHPPKKAPGESSKLRPSPEKEMAPEVKTSLIVKMKYKKRIATNLQRILRISPKPSNEYLRLERERQASLNPQRGPKPSKRESSEEAELPLSTVSAKASTSNKRPSSTNERSEPAAKRAKLSDSVDASKEKRPLETTFKSPAPAAKSQKDLLPTPKKEEPIKSVAMRKVGSTDSSVRTPQTMNTNTPASAETSRVGGGDARSYPSDDRQQQDAKRLGVEARNLKRKMDQILQTKLPGGPVSVTEEDRKHGYAVGIECVTRYMELFALTDRLNKGRNFTMWESNVGLWTLLERSTLEKHPILHALNLQLGAILKQEIGRAYTENLQRNPQKYAADLTFIGGMTKNFLELDQNWKEARKSRFVLAELGAPEALGPWTTVGQATVYIHAVLELYAKKEKTGWRLSTS
ncbi:uncharacterized protein L3040_009551 [Drepanopeziza brunnea f. sp. 'multigermtubi']|nr:hypothetical protein L3040_009551 [Drepanopeziza brunnea f. sp. 'multigermtubi']